MIKPIFSEKTLALSKIGRFTFKVARDLNKHQIKARIEELFPVNVISVSTINYKSGERRTLRGRTVKTAPFKKAIVILKTGQSIDLWEAPKTPEEKKESKKTKKS